MFRAPQPASDLRGCALGLAAGSTSLVSKPRLGMELSGSAGTQGSQWGTGLLCGRPWLWDEGAVITGGGTLGMQGQEHVGCREVRWCSGVLWVQCGVRGALEVAEVQRRLVGAVWVAESASREPMGHQGVQGVQ